MKKPVTDVNETELSPEESEIIRAIENAISRLPMQAPPAELLLRIRMTMTRPRLQLWQWLITLTMVFLSSPALLLLERSSNIYGSRIKIATYTMYALLLLSLIALSAMLILDDKTTRRKSYGKRIDDFLDHYVLGISEGR